MWMCLHLSVTATVAVNNNFLLPGHVYGRVDGYSELNV